MSIYEKTAENIYRLAENYTAQVEKPLYPENLNGVNPLQMGIRFLYELTADTLSIVRSLNALREKELFPMIDKAIVCAYTDEKPMTRLAGELKAALNSYEAALGNREITLANIQPTAKKATEAAATLIQALVTESRDVSAWEFIENPVLSLVKSEWARLAVLTATNPK